MAKVRLEVCIGCALSESYIATCLETLKESYSNDLEVVLQECLDVCEILPALQLNGEILLIAETQTELLKEKVAEALLLQKTQREKT